MNTSVFILSVIIFLFLFYYFAYRAVPAKGKSGSNIGENVIDSARNDTFTIATYNVQSGKNLAGKRDIGLAAHRLKNIDIVAIQEVYGKPWLGSKSQIEQLSVPSHSASLFAPTRRRWFKDHRGNGLLTKLPLTDWQYRQLPDQSGKQFRNVITAFLNFKNERIAIIATHLHTKIGKEEQLKTVFAEFQKHSHAILLGDLNTSKNNGLLQKLIQQSGAKDTIAITKIGDSDSRIDWILSKQLSFEHYQYEPKGISDHPMYAIRVTGVE